MSNILHGFTDPKYLEVLIAKAETQLREAEGDEDRQRFAAYLEVLKGWKEKIGAGGDSCAPRENES
jgi:predicted house-cleaning noncanonical NTP pyrophosphatase (MazG superfamily)